MRALQAQRGNAITSVLLVIVLIAAAALVIDLGYTRMVHYQLQAGADAGAHAGIAFFDGTAAGLTTAKSSAQSVAGSNQANGAAIALETNGNDATADDIVTGIWTDGAFVASTDADSVNALQVTTHIDSFTAFFSKVAFGTDALRSSARATGLKPPSQPPGAVECFIPVALPLCGLEAYAPGTLPSITFEFSSATEDNSSWASLVGHPNAADLRDQIANCNDQGEAWVGDDVYVNNGAIASALTAMANAVSASSTYWNTAALGPLPPRMPGSAIPVSKYGRTFEGPILIFDEGNQACDDVAFVHDYPLVGFAWGVVYDVRSTGSAKNIRMRVNNTLSMSFGIAGGGQVDAGVIYDPPPMLVR